LRYLSNFIIFSLFFLGCSQTNLEESISLSSNKKKVVAGESVKLLYFSQKKYDSVEVFLKNKNISISYGKRMYDKNYIINRIILSKESLNIDDYYLEAFFVKGSEVSSKKLNITVEPSVIINSFCSTNECSTTSGNIVQQTINKLNINTYRLAATKITYTVNTPYTNYTRVHEFNSPINNDWLDNIVFDNVPVGISSYIASVSIVAEDSEGDIAENVLPFRVVRPIEIKHFGEYELAETYIPIPVTGCIPGSIGNNVQYSESESETKQNSVSLTLNKNWSDSNSLTENIGRSEGISVNETENTVYSSSLSRSETNGESYSNSVSNGESSNISFNTSDGENWSWDINESQTQGSANSNTNSSNTSVSGSVTTGFSGEGSLPFLAKASGKVEVSAGVSRGWGNSNSSTESESNSNSRGYSSGGTTQNGRTYGSVQNDSRSHSLSGSYVLSSSTSNSITESSGLSSGRVWNMSESIASGKTVTTGNSESLAETLVASSSSSTTFSYSAYIPRGRYGIFYRQTSRYVKLSEVITYDLNGFPHHSGFVSMNTWAWAPELSIGEDCNNMPEPNLPEATCHIPPCGE
jgi:hypothetical protein